jgi:hypothetical protein
MYARLKRLVQRLLSPKLSEKIGEIYGAIRNTILKLNYFLFYRGDKYCCSCCGKGFNKFMNFEPLKFNANVGKEIVSECLCPFCRSKPRHRAECCYLESLPALTREQNILKFAPTESMKIYFKRKDIGFKSADYFRRNVDLNLDIQNIALPDSSQDLIICNQILEHVADDKKAISELARIVKPSGMLMITVPIDTNLPSTIEDESNKTYSSSEREKRYGQFDHLRLYALSDFESRLKDWFDVEIFDASKVDSNVYPLFGPSYIDMNLIFVCRKREVVNL